jgi:MraZ protein
MAGLTYTYECKIDAKGRVLLPTKLKSELLPVILNGFIIKRSIFNQCLELWPKNEWDLELDKLNQLNRYQERNVRFLRKFLAGVKPVDLDASGRLLIPKDLIAFAAIEKNIVMTSVIDKIEIWDKEKYEADQQGDEDFKALAEDVMGNFGNIQTPQ